MAIKSNFLVEKQNILNEIRTNNMSLQELRFFSIYLAKINPRDISTRVVSFSLSDFQKIMELDRLKIDYLKRVINSLLSKIVHVPIDSKGAFSAFQLFKKCKLINIDDEWFVEIDAHDDALPLMFEFKEKYFSYQLWNALRLKSSNQLRMYEILKQYEKAGERIIAIDELRELLGISRLEYVRWDNFKKSVLEVCKKSIEENTDIKFTYEPYGKRGRGGKVNNLRFVIYNNKNHKDPLTLDKFIKNQDFISDQLDIIITDSLYKKRFDFLKDACMNEFTDEEFQVIYNLLMQIMPVAQSNLDLEQYQYLMRKYDELNMYASKKNIKNRFGYLKKLISLDLD